jgi:hypothetical protein
MYEFIDLMGMYVYVLLFISGHSQREKEWEQIY